MNEMILAQTAQTELRKRLMRVFGRGLRGVLSYGVRWDRTSGEPSLAVDVDSQQDVASVQQQLGPTIGDFPVHVRSRSLAQAHTSRLVHA